MTHNGTYEWFINQIISSFSQFLDIGIITSVEINHKQVEFARKGQEVCIKIEPIPGESPKMLGRHFDEKDMLVSKVSEYLIDLCLRKIFFIFNSTLAFTSWFVKVISPHTTTEERRN